VNWIKVDTELCKHDGACVAVCPPRILFLNDRGLPQEVSEGSQERCILCGHCVAVCASNALSHAGLPQDVSMPVTKEHINPGAMDGFLISRRSVREFKERPVARDILAALLDVARRAPTASNSQKLHWIVADGREKVHSLAQETMNRLRTSEIAPALVEEWDKGYDFILRGAPTLIVACAPADYQWGKQDCAIALTFLELAAEARGLGVCWAGYLTRVAAVHPPLLKKLSVPEGYMVHGGLMIGERKFSYRTIPPRRPLSVQWI